MRHSWTIFRYLIGAVVPYFLPSWVLLSVILFVQQAGRFADIFFSVNIPGKLIWQLAFALIPNVIAFTCPMAVLVGTVIGLSKMQGDSELVAIRAVGVGNFHIVLPIILLGVLLSGFTFAINLFGVPIAARVVRQVAMQTAIYKLESPIEPGVFNTEVAGYTIYVKDGDLTNGTWKNIFIYTEDAATGSMRLITSQKGRIDSTDQLSELVLEDAVSTTITPENREEKFVSERIGEVRFAIKTQRGELIEKLARAESSAEELGLTQLSEFAKSREGRERIEAEILWQRRITLGITPIIFCLLGAALVLRFNRGGRGYGAILSLAGLITYYLFAFLGEQLARTGNVSVFVGSLIPIGFSVLLIIWLLWGSKIHIFSYLAPLSEKLRELFSGDSRRLERRNLFVDVTTGLRDFDILVNLIKYFVITLAFLASVFVIFTAFELWRFAGTMDGGIALLAKYLVFLLPFIYLQLAPSSAMIATLVTYVIKSRQNEVVTWTSAGQSVYRLLAPCFVLMLVIGGINFAVQEVMAPRANLLQDEFRQQLRSRGKPIIGPGKFWVAEGNKIYSFTYNTDASDNERRVEAVTIFEFADSGELQTLYRSPEAIWVKTGISLVGPVKKSALSNGTIENSLIKGNVDVAADSNPFKEIRKKPSQLSIAETKARIEDSESEVEKRSFEVALEKKWSTLFLPFIIAMFTSPFALSLNRKGKAATVGYAVALWLVFMGVTSAFEQLGLSGALPPVAAVMGPLMLFAMLGAYLLTKVKT